MSFGALSQVVEGFGVFEIQGHGWTLDERMSERLAGLLQVGPKQSPRDAESADEKEAQLYAESHCVPVQKVAGMRMA